VTEPDTVASGDAQRGTRTRAEILASIHMRGIEWLGMRLPRPVGLTLAAAYHRVFFATAHGQRDIVASNLSRVLGHPPQSPIVQAAMLLAAVTGLRQGDILRIRRSDFAEDGLTVRTGKTGKAMTFGWSEGLRRAVLAAVGARDFIPMVLLSTQRGAAYTGDGFRSLWHRAMTAARKANPGMEPYTYHDLRAKAASESRDWQLLGHMDRRTFERVYNRLPRQVTPSR
jgi:integrase